MRESAKVEALHLHGSDHGGLFRTVARDISHEKKSMAGAGKQRQARGKAEECCCLHGNLRSTSTTPLKSKIDTLEKILGTKTAGVRRTPVYTPDMDPLKHLLTAALLVLVLRWLWKSSNIETAREESGRKIFPPTRAIRILMPLIGILFTAMVVFSSIALREPRNWWVPYLFLAFALLPI